MINFLTTDPLHTLGYHPNNKGEFVTHNLANAFGYLPLIGTIVGLARMIFAGYEIIASGSFLEEKEFYRTEFMRGAVEFFSFGVCFLIPDYLVWNAEHHDVNSLGFHFKEEAHFKNILKAIGYLPLIGTIVGVARICFAMYQLKNSKLFLTLHEKESLTQFYQEEIWRGGIELFSLGFTLIVPDIIVTRGRNLNPNFF